MRTNVKVQHVFICVAYVFVTFQFDICLKSLTAGNSYVITTLLQCDKKCSELS